MSASAPISPIIVCRRFWHREISAACQRPTATGFWSARRPRIGWRCRIIRPGIRSTPCAARAYRSRLTGRFSDAAKFKHMTFGHRLLTRYAAQDRALACQIMPDAMYTDGTIETAMLYGARGAHAVLAVALRLNEEGLFAELRSQGLVPPRAAAARSGAPIVLQSRAAVGPSVRNLYYDCVAHDWDSPSFPTWPSFCAWRVPGRAEMLFHSAYFAYILLDFGAVTRHNERSFEAASIENYWLADNFADPNAIHIVRDSDEAMVVSWTPMPVRPPPSRRRLNLACRSSLRYGRDFGCGACANSTLQLATAIKPIIYAFRSDGVRKPMTQLGMPPRPARANSLWFFGDAFGEFTEGVSPAVLLLLRAWWLILYSGATLSARSGRAFQRSQIALKQFLHRCRQRRA